MPHVKSLLPTPSSHASLSLFFLSSARTPLPAVCIDPSPSHTPLSRCRRIRISCLSARLLPSRTTHCMSIPLSSLISSLLPSLPVFSSYFLLFILELSFLFLSLTLICLCIVLCDDGSYSLCYSDFLCVVNTAIWVNMGTTYVDWSI